MKIEFVDLKRQLGEIPPGETKTLREEIEEEMGKECISKTAFIMGPQLEKFEKQFAEYCGRKYCVGLNSGTDAVEFALRCSGITSGNVLTVSNTYFTSVSSISMAGATPKFVDINSKTYNIDPDRLEEAIDKETKAILLVHFYGRPVEMDRIAEISNRHGLKIIEDCAHAPGAMFEGRKSPFYGTGAFSFFPGKNIGAWGDAGALVTDDEEVAKMARLWRNDGSERKYHHEILGRKARLDPLQATVLGVKLKYLDGWNERRLENAKYYNKLLSGIEEIQLPLLDDNKTKPIFHVYNVLTDRRDELSDFLVSRGISAGIHYPNPVHLQPAYKSLGLREGTLPNTEAFSKRTLSLPMFPELKKEEINYISEAIREFYKK